MKKRLVLSAEQMMQWINKASYPVLLQKSVVAPFGDPFFMGNVGKHYLRTLQEKRQKAGENIHQEISKRLGLLH